MQQILLCLMHQTKYEHGRVNVIDMLTVTAVPVSVYRQPFTPTVTMY